ncbi:hypothetical protein G6F70_007205 [Rhizopus microsporus]|uniref:ATP synthase mitochondrial F1 complex assembly factor 1 n=2 Tax=Rhizopus TaxID=4842 RepID=A0A367IV29_RHIAZ|nr:hypothetical protein G6F71_007148 [Rhizopus microsporus]RCH81553.1 ATP synthase mitochondrial F1 complex assembly factor 1 [Rhizopus azygosporus]KAG1196729.1 hypothetical protein G6F70_007205 [Rhizopus microsporus]KAG1208559.1 hypothetical protein G6F69_007113 [Rhizopus microsporus]KAG1229894.1 hypothetical protein G6F67_006834 [Rhizopus microsporus]
MLKSTTRAISRLSNNKLPTTFFLQTRHAEVLNSPASVFFGGQKWERIKQIALEANRVNVDYESKYYSKLKKVAQQKGLTVRELKENTLAQKKKHKPQINYAAVQTVPEQKKKNVNQQEASSKYESSAPTLDKVVKLDLLLKEDPGSISEIWTRYHANKDCISAVIPGSIYNRMYEISKKYPMFILPMPREVGLEFFFLQFQSHQCYFTSLLEYKTKGEKARPFLTITHFPELLEEKGIVLMKGEINDNPKRMLSTSNAQFLAFALQRFYATDDQRKLKLVEQFNDSPQTFDYHDLLDEIDSIV